MGGPKALLIDESGRSLAARAVGVLLEGGCTSVIAVLGARAAAVAAALASEGFAGDERVRSVMAADWRPILDPLDPSSGARAYVAQHETTAVPCDDIGDGADLDRPEDALAYGFQWPDGSTP
jgi:CTP:molybdopterin cytidylyltransferase MocA